MATDDLGAGSATRPPVGASGKGGAGDPAPLLGRAAKICAARRKTQGLCRQRCGCDI